MIRLVVDSGSQLTPELRARLHAAVVPLTVVVDGTPLHEGEQIDAAGITEAFERGARLATSTPRSSEVRDSNQASPASGTA